MAWEAQSKYEKNKCKQVKFRLRLDKDADIIEWLKQQPNVNAKLRELIRAEMES
jgi:hypothetical protein